ncbi:MAG: hypothetical protein ACFFFC_16480 [Candidatus Thorarchaeota archaeon]
MSGVSEDRYHSDKGRFSVWPSGKDDSSIEGGPMTQDNEIRLEYTIPWDDTGESILRIMELKASEVFEVKDSLIKME